MSGAGVASVEPLAGAPALYPTAFDRRLPAPSVWPCATTATFDATTLARCYPGGLAEFAERFATATAMAVEAGFLLAADADEVMALGPAMAAAVWPGQDEPAVRR